MKNGKKRSARAASLTGDLLVRAKGDRKAGFVLATNGLAKPDVEPEGRAPPPEATARAPEAPAKEEPYVRVGDWSRPGAEPAGPQALVQALRAGQLARAEGLFRAMTGLSEEKLKEVLYGDSGNSLAMACRALGFDHLQFASTLILSRKLGLSEAEGDPRVLGRASAIFEDTAQDAARAMLERWRKDEGAG